MAQPLQPPDNMPMIQPGQQPSPDQIRIIQQKIAEKAASYGMPPQQYVQQLQAQAMQQQQMQMRMQQMQQQQGGQGGPPGGPQGQPPPQQQQQMQGPPPGQPQQIPIQGGQPPKPEALAIANFLKSQDLKTRTCLFNNQRKELFRVKRAIRALQSPAYAKARTKNPLLPDVHDRVTAENSFKMLPMSLLALRVSKIDPHEGHGHGAKKRTKGLWTVKVEQQQEAHDDMHYCWLYEGSQLKMKLYAGGALLAILAIVFFPVWPYKLRLGVWYLSMAALGLLGLFFGIAIVRLILFVITMFAAPPGLWLYPNLFEDVGFFDSFKPVWAWQDTPESLKKAKEEKKAKKAARAARKAGVVEESGEEEAGETDTAAHTIDKKDISAPVGVDAKTSGREAVKPSANQRIPQQARVEEVDED